MSLPPYPSTHVKLHLEPRWSSNWSIQPWEETRNHALVFYLRELEDSQHGYLDYHYPNDQTTYRIYLPSQISVPRPHFGDQAKSALLGIISQSWSLDTSAE